MGTRTMARAAAALLLAVTLTGAAAGPVAAQAAEDPAVAPLLGELERAWARRDGAGVVALFAPDGVILIDPASLHHAGATYQAGGGQPLGVGVPVLLGEPTDRIDVAGRQTAALVFRGAPATLVRWGYQQVGQVGLRGPEAVGLPPLPPVTGTDELVLQGGRIARYTRTPDPASVEALRRALLAGARARAARASAAEQPAARDTQARRTPSIGPWLVALGLSLAGVLLLALLKRPPETP